MSTITLRRLRNELSIIEKRPLRDIKVELVDSRDLFHWKAIIKGPLNSPYAGGYFLIDIQIPDAYPFLPPKLVFVTRIFHPNISTDGDICFKKSDWTSALSITDLLFTILDLLEYPDFDKPGRTHISDMGKKNYRKYYLFAKRFTEKYALKSMPF
nr:hypothetical transcript [Hymenolepis microstoma]